MVDYLVYVKQLWITITWYQRRAPLRFSQITNSIKEGVRYMYPVEFTHVCKTGVLKNPLHTCKTCVKYHFTHLNSLFTHVKYRIRVHIVACTCNWSARNVRLKVHAPVKGQIKSNHINSSQMLVISWKSFTSPQHRPFCKSWFVWRRKGGTQNVSVSF